MRIDTVWMKGILVACAFALLGCASPSISSSMSSPETSASGIEWYRPMPQTISERSKNKWACEQTIYLERDFLAVLDEAAFSDQNVNMDFLIQDYVDAMSALGMDIDTPFGDYIQIHAAAIEAQYFDPDQSDYEETAALGEALNNGESVELEDGSLFDRCSRLGVDLQ